MVGTTIQKILLISVFLREHLYLLLHAWRDLKFRLPCRKSFSEAELSTIYHLINIQSQITYIHILSGIFPNTDVPMDLV